MGTTKTDDEAVTEATEVKPDEETVDATAAETDEEASVEDDLVENGSEGDEEGPTGVGQGAAAVVSAALGFVSLTGSWIGTVASERQQLVGQLHAQSSSSSSVAKLLDEGYGQAWQATALWGGVFALLALIVGVVVLARPAFGAPGKPQATWIKSVSWGGVVLGVIGLLLAVLKYTDVLLGLPSAS
ncbi:hypothetical protein [Streptomyces cylindrosporus]|uniref:Integral membrane protein n=1 Tax=Streptomyces cylindrosporus TaxID=2927583 RepID=A0ABS9Y7T9_9ACTN|nr:hypothetical protein [Streptomyces cylindrosporus]MCI3273290.1 hypothetical protein [Streptomyces cylindrosporus]